MKELQSKRSFFLPVFGFLLSFTPRTKFRLLRLDPGKPSLTVTGFIFNKFVHPYENRFISAREAARLQGFPDDIEFKGSLTSTQLTRPLAYQLRLETTSTVPLP
jgi:site-specific DNA-cytosine methylase